MGKSSHFTGQPILAQLLSFIPRTIVQRISRETKADRYCKSFGAYEHTVTMLYAVLNRCSSLREIVSGMQASSTRLAHLGLKSTPRRSTLADAGARRDPAFFQQLYEQLYRLHFGISPDSLKGKGVVERLYIIDSTTITLFSDVLQGAGSYRKNGKKKGGVKAHLCARAQHDVGAFVCLTEAKCNDNTFLTKLRLPPGSIVVFDKGYRNYRQWASWTEQGITWVTRLNDRSVYKVITDSTLSDKQLEEGLLADQVIELGNPETAKKNPVQTVRMITYQDPESKKVFQFITNNRHLGAATVCGIYKRRWQIELLFKRIKSAFQLHFFIGDNENAIYTQVWCTLIADLLLQIVKRTVARAKARWSMANLTAIVRLHLTTYIDLIAFLLAPEKALLNYQDPYHKKQLALFAT